MKELSTLPLTELRRRLSHFKNDQLLCLKDVRSQIFNYCETDNCASYICNLSNGTLEEVRGFLARHEFSHQPLTLSKLDSSMHPQDRRLMHLALGAIADLAEQKPILSTDFLSCAYRIKLNKKYVHVYRKSGLAVKEKTGELVNWSNLYITALINKKFELSWTGTNIIHQDVLAQMQRRVTSIFTRRENEILSLLKNGKSSSEITAEICISSETLKKHLNNMFKKTGIQGRHQLLRFTEHIAQ